jgi:hypothetical protein
MGKKTSKIVWGDILMWKQPLQTTTVFVAGLAAFGVLTFAAYGAHKMTVMSGEERCKLRGNVLNYSKVQCWGARHAFVSCRRSCMDTFHTPGAVIARRNAQAPTPAVSRAEKCMHTVRAPLPRLDSWDAFFESCQGVCVVYLMF